MGCFRGKNILPDDSKIWWGQEPCEEDNEATASFQKPKREHCFGLSGAEVNNTFIIVQNVSNCPWLRGILNNSAVAQNQIDTQESTG